MNKQEIYQQVVELLTKLFDLDADAITPESRLYEDLELDSIDAIDLVVHLQKSTGKKIKPEMFKSVRTVQDIVDAVADLLVSEAL